MSTPANSTTTSTMSNLVLAAYDKLVEFQLRSEPLFRNFADKRPADVDKPGSSVVLQRYQDLAVATSALTQADIPDAVALSNTTSTTITLNEYGNSVLTTELLSTESLSAIDPYVANVIAWNMRDSLDTLVRNVLIGGTNVVYCEDSALNTTGPTNTLAATDVFSSKAVRYVVSKLRGNSAVPGDGGYYTGLIHPDQSHDLRAETGTAAWRDPHVYSGANSIWNGEIGVYEGVRFIESPRIKQATDGTGSAKVSRGLIFGRQALAEAVGYEPKVVAGPITDNLLRFRPLGWKALIGWAIYRQEAIYRVESGSTY